MNNTPSKVFPVRAVLLAVGLLCAGHAFADATTDGQLSADQASYKAQQDTIQSLNDTGKHPLRSYSLAKAQCWLDVSFHEYTRNDRSGFPTAALTESRKITDYLGKGGNVGGQDNPAWQTPLVNGAPKLRTDLWDQAAALRKHAGWRCAEKLAACGEVELVHAGNEHQQQGWRHAKPYIQIAEDLIGEARTAAEGCPVPVVKAVEPPPPPPPPAPPPPPPPAPVTIVTEKIILNASVLFNFDRRHMEDLLPGGRAQLDQLVTKLDRVYARVDRLTLDGYTDRLGTDAYNQTLSTDRAEAIKAYLQSRGVKVDVVAVGHGAADPVVTCNDRNHTALTQCLQPNRRVEISITGVPR